MRGMNTERKSNRGRPPIGRTRMVTVGIRVEPAERAQLERRAAASGQSLCAYLRELIRRELDGTEVEAGGRTLRACS